MHGEARHEAGSEFKRAGPDFLEQAYASDPRLGRCFDVLAYHPYAYPFTAPELPVPARGSVLSAAGQMRAVLRRHGGGRVPLWITEVGWPTSGGYGVSEAKQAQYVARMQSATFAEGVPVLAWYAYGDVPDPTGANQEAHFGFFRADGSAKPAYAALRTFDLVFAGARFVADRSRALGLPAARTLLDGGGYALTYRTRRAAITALWLADESAAEGQGPLPPGGNASPPATAVRLPVTSRRVTVMSYLGTRRRLVARRGVVELRLGPGPMYVIDPHRRPRAVTPGARLERSAVHGMRGRLPRGRRHRAAD